MKFKHTHRPGFLLGFIDFFTAGLFFLVYMRLGLQDELEYILGHKVLPYWKAYLLGIPTLFIYPLIWMARIAEELRARAIEMGVAGPYTSWWHIFGWNIFGLLLLGPAVATMRFFDTLNKVEIVMNRMERKITLFYESEVDPLIAMKIVSHTDDQTTANIYTHVGDEMLKKTTVSMNEVFQQSMED